MDLKQLVECYLKKVAANPAVPQVQQQAQSLQDQVMDMQEDSSVVDADIQKEQPVLGQKAQNLEIEDLMLQNAMPEMQLPDSDDSTFGKVSCFRALQKRAAKTQSRTLYSLIKTRYATTKHSR